MTTRSRRGRSSSRSWARAMTGPATRPSSCPCGLTRGLAVACGINPRYGKIDPYAMAGCVIDEAVRNCVAVGGDPSRIAILDNFCWGNTERPETLGSLVRAARASTTSRWPTEPPSSRARTVSTMNSLTTGGACRFPRRPDQRHRDRARHSLLRDDGPQGRGKLLYVLGTTHRELGGSLWSEVRQRPGGRVPRVDTVKDRASSGPSMRRSRTDSSGAATT